MRRLSSALILAAVSAGAASAASALAGELAGLLDASPLMTRSMVGVQVIDADSGEVIFERSPDVLFTPASNMKVYTSACALATWGADHRFETRVLRAGDDLILQGGGDPTLNAADLRAMAAEVHEQGISEVDEVIVDNSLFDPTLKGPGWMWDDDPDVYNMSVTAMMLNYNVLDVVVGTGALVPESDYPPVERVPGGRNRVTRPPFTDPILIAGTPEGASAELTMHDPGPWAASVFEHMLEDAGVEVGSSRATNEPQSGEVVVTHAGRPLSEVIALFNKPSENAIGEMLIHDLGVHAGHTSASWADGAAAETAWLTTEVGLTEDEVEVRDGSGLSRYNQICASGTNQLLRHMWQRPDRNVFVNSLPIAGVDGTLRSRMDGTVAEGNVRAKTGTMSGVSCLSGYVRTAGGQTLILSILTNGLGGSSNESRALQDRLCVAMASAQ